MLIKFTNKKYELRKHMREFDERCFPEEMYQSDEELEAMLSGNVTGLLAIIESAVVGFAVIIDETDIAPELADFDPQFQAQKNGVYSYSVAVLPGFQRMGIAKKLLQTSSAYAKSKGATRLTGHIRTANGWHDARANILHPTERRLVQDAWEEGSVEFQVVDL